MAKILKKNEQPTNTEYGFTCANCGCTFETEDYERYNVIDPVTKQEFHMTFCPKCTKSVYKVCK